MLLLLLVSVMLLGLGNCNSLQRGERADDDVRLLRKREVDKLQQLAAIYAEYGAAMNAKGTKQRSVGNFAEHFGNLEQTAQSIAGKAREITAAFKRDKEMKRTVSKTGLTERSLEKTGQLLKKIDGPVSKLAMLNSDSLKRELADQINPAPNKNAAQTLGMSSKKTRALLEKSASLLKKSLEHEDKVSKSLKRALDFEGLKQSVKRGLQQKAISSSPSMNAAEKLVGTSSKKTRALVEKSASLLKKSLEHEDKVSKSFKRALDLQAMEGVKRNLEQQGELNEEKRSNSPFANLGLDWFPWKKELSKSGRNVMKLEHQDQMQEKKRNNAHSAYFGLDWFPWKKELEPGKRAENNIFANVWDWKEQLVPSMKKFTQQRSQATRNAKGMLASASGRNTEERDLTVEKVGDCYYVCSNVCDPICYPSCDIMC